MKENQIEEMAKDIDKSHWIIEQDYRGCNLNSIEIAEHLYNAGYRKQSEGEWEQVRKLFVAVNPYQHTCNMCGKSYFDHNKFNYPFCPNCGAKMKGGNNG